MPRTGKSVGVGLVLGLLLGLPTGVPTASAVAPAPGPAPTVRPAPGPMPATGRPVTVTLLTGDRVTVTGDQRVSVQPGPGRAGMTFLTTRTPDGLTVVPRDAMVLVASSRVDRRLFDVTGLVSAGYDDARRDTLPLLVRYRGGQERPVVAGARPTRELPAVGATAVQAAKDRAAAVWAGFTTGTAVERTALAGGIDRIWLDGRRRVPLGRADGVTVTTPLAAPSHSMSVTVLDVAGAPSVVHHTVLFGLDEDFLVEVPRSDGPVTLRVPRGRYGLISSVFDADGGVALLAQPELTVDRDLPVTVDARTSGPVRMTVPEAGAVPVVVHLGADGGRYGVGVSAAGFTGLRSGRIGGSTPAPYFQGTVGAQWAHPEVVTTPYLYTVSENLDGTLPNGFVRDYRRRDLAAVTQRFHAGPGVVGSRQIYPEYEGRSAGWGTGLRVAVPGGRVEYFNASRGLSWRTVLEIGVPGEHGMEMQTTHSSLSTTYQPGRRYRDEWNAPPSGPSLPRLPGAGITRQGDTITVGVPTHTDAHGHIGGSAGSQQRTVLYRNGRVVGESPHAGYGRFVVGPEPAEYRVETRITRDFTDLSTEVTAAWTFRSAHVPGSEPVGQPATVVRFAPELDDAGSAPAGRTWAVPVRIERQFGAPAAPVTSLTVQVSYDGGATWQPARVRKLGAGWVATVRHPVGPGRVSLRADATARDGSRVSQRTMQAYRLR